jgi:hypothetical protein
MKINTKNNRYSFQLLLHLQKNKVTEDQDGYAMLITSIIAILFFSLLSVYLFSTNLYKSASNAIVDSGSTFYAAETGMNKRASLMSLRFEGLSRPSGDAPLTGTTGATVAQQMQQCIDASYDTTGVSTDNASTVGTNDFKCRVNSFNYRESMWKANGSNSSTEEYDQSASTPTKYLAYSFVKKMFTSDEPAFTKVPTGEPFAGLNMQEYKYRVYTTAIKKSQGYLPVTAQTLLQMDFNSRVIPLFQFMAFYKDDMEIEPGSAMSLTGTVHTNGRLMLAPIGSGGIVTLSGIFSASQDIYDSLQGYSSASYTGGGGTIKDTGTGTTTSRTNKSSPMTRATLDKFGTMLQPRANQLNVPEPNFMTKVDATQPGGIGEYYGKADLQLEFRPNQSVPFSLTAIKTGLASSTATANEDCTGVTISTRRQGGILKCSVLNEGQRRSLMQPVLISELSNNDSSASQASLFCGVSIASSGVPSIDITRKTKVVRALQTAIVSQASPLPYASVSTGLKLQSDSTLAGVKTIFNAYVDSAASGLTAAEKTALKGATVTPEQIAAVNGGCFAPPPITAILAPANVMGDSPVKTAPTSRATIDSTKPETSRTFFYDRHESRAINLLQTNIRSLAAWNYYNISVGWTSNVLNTATDSTGNNGGLGNNTDELLFQRATLNTAAVATSLPGLRAGTVAANKSFGAADRSEGGLVVHNTIDKSTYSYTAKKSPYGFAFAQGSTLPAPLTVASEQAIYLQGNYNTVNNQPAAMMGDTINILSQACWDNTRGVKGPTTNECGQFVARNTSDSIGMHEATETTVRAAFLAKIKKTIPDSEYSGGLNNYPRFLEDWKTTINFNYSGSFVSLGEPTEFSGPFSGNGYYQRPVRNWSYDTNFNDSTKLPPLTPRAVYVKQRVFKRDFLSDRN